MILSRWSKCVLVYLSWLLNHVIYFKLSKEWKLCKVKQITKITLKIVLDEQSWSKLNRKCLSRTNYPVQIMERVRPSNKFTKVPWQIGGLDFDLGLVVIAIISCIISMLCKW